MEMFSMMDTYLQGFWFIAIPVSVIFVIQTIMTFVGANASDGLTADFDGDFSGADAPFQLFSLRNLINFLLDYKKENSFLLDFIYFFTTFALILPLEHVRRKNNCKLFYFNIL